MATPKPATNSTTARSTDDRVDIQARQERHDWRQHVAEEYGQDDRNQHLLRELKMMTWRGQGVRSAPRPDAFTGVALPIGGSG